jgi:hypothetical protein
MCVDGGNKLMDVEMLLLISWGSRGRVPPTIVPLNACMHVVECKCSAKNRTFILLGELSVEEVAKVD